jgi:prolyl 4-hydroxylase
VPEALRHVAIVSTIKAIHIRSACAMPAVTDLVQLRTRAEGGRSEDLFRFASALSRSGAADEAYTHYLRAAHEGHAPSKVECARMLLYGIDRPVDVEAAIAWLLKAEAAGDVVAGYLLALIGVGGSALPFDAQVNSRVLAAVNAGYPPALRAAAIHFGRSPDAGDQSLCIALLDKAAQAGDGVAALLLAERLALGEGCDADPHAAAQLLAQLSAQGFAALPRISVPLPIGPALPPRTLALEDVLRPPSPQVLSQSPGIAVASQLLSADECRLLMAMSTPLLRRSRTLDPATGLPMQQVAPEQQVRTSSDASHDPVVEDLALRLVQQRMATAAGVDLLNAEPLIVLRYQPGEQYRPHRDYLNPGSLQRDRPQAGNRARSICAYLSPVVSGGETDFPLAGVRVAPVPGSAVIFDSLTAAGHPDPRSLHAGLPVVEGEKWLATLWLRQQRYRWF